MEICRTRKVAYESLIIKNDSFNLISFLMTVNGINHFK